MEVISVSEVCIDGVQVTHCGVIFSKKMLMEIELSGDVKKKKRVYLKTLSKQVGGWSRPCQNFFNELIFDIRWGQIPF